MSETESEELLAYMIDQANGAIAGARGAYQTELDFSLDSLDRLDKVLQKMHQEHVATPIPFDRVALLTLAFGAYVGETIRRHVGHGEWRRGGPPHGEGSLPLYLGPETGIWPMVWVLKAMIEGETDSLRFKARVAMEVLEKER